ncbi:MAG: hypothetical protein GXX96_04045 [Planctomycetaceae bacterium]|nr:hypothetical protein [Planctomycetaceae bacterium]
MYSLNENYAGGEFRSAITGKAYQYECISDGSDKKRARREMEADHARIKADLAARLGREPTSREMLRGVTPTDSRSLRERIAQDALRIAPKVHSGNPHAARLAELESQVCRTAAERAARDRRIEQLRQASSAWEAASSAQQAAAEARAKIESDLVDARANLAKARFGIGFSPEDVRKTERMLRDLEQTGDVAAYRKARDAWEKEVQEWREAGAKKLDAEAAEQRRLAALIRRGEAVADEKPPAEPERN